MTPFLKKHTSYILTLLLTLGVVYSTSLLAAPTQQTLGFQGEFFNYGTPGNAPVQATFTFHTTETGNTPSGSTITKIIPVVHGYFATEFTDTDTQGVDFNQQLYLEISINGTTLAPRTPVRPSVASFKTFGTFSHATPPTPGIAGSLYFNTTTNELYVSTGSAWQRAGTASTTQQWFDNGTDLYFTTGNVGVGTSTPVQKLTVSNGSIGLDNTTSTSTGVIYKNGVPFLHNYANSFNAGQNTFLGLNAGNFSIVDLSTDYRASFNTGVGTDSLNGLTTGYSNTALGAGAYKSMATGDNNVAIGAFAGYSQSTGYQNIAIGPNALASAQWQWDNIAIGKNALSGIAGGVAVSNIALGVNTGTSLVSGVGNILIGNSVQTLTATSSYFLNIGNTVYGNTQSGNVGVGSTTPGARLSVKGLGTTTGLLAQFTDSANAPKVTILDNGNVGIGSSNPQYLLDVKKAGGTGVIIGSFGDTSNNSRISFKPYDTSIEAFVQGSFGTTLKFNSGGFSLIDSGNTGNNLLSYDGVGLHVKNITSSSNNGASYNQLKLTSNWYPSNDSANPAINFTTYNSAGSSDQLSKFEIYNGDLGKILLNPTGGNVGIGTTTPGEKLSVAGNVSTTGGFRLGVSSSIQNTTGAVGAITWGSMNSSGGNTLTFSGFTDDITFGNNIILGSNKLQKSASQYIQFGNGVGPNDIPSTLFVGSQGSDPGNPIFRFWDNSAYAGHKVFGIGGGTTYSEYVTVRNDGTVGIGTTTPSARLAITGTAGTADIFRISSSTNASLLSVSSNGTLVVGNGTRADTTTLDVVARGDSDGIRLYSLNNPAGGSVNPPSISFYRSIGSPSSPARFKISGFSSSDHDGFTMSSPNASADWIAGTVGGALPSLGGNSLTPASTTAMAFYQQAYFAQGVIVSGWDSTASTVPLGGIIRSGQKNNAVTDIGGSNLTLQAGNGTGASTVGGNLIFQTPDATTSGTALQQYSTKMMIARNGNVGIGTTNPNAKIFSIGDATYPAAAFSNSFNQNTLSIFGSGNSDTLTLTSAGYNSAAINLTKTTGTATTNNNNAGLLINGTYNHNGSFGLGRGIDISVTNNTGTSNVLYGANILATANSAGATAVGLNVSALSSGGASYAALFNGGNVGLGTTTPSAQFTTTGTVRFASLTGAGANLVVDSLGNVTVSSDERLKDIQGVYESGLAQLKNINPILYKWNATTGYDTTSTYAGFSAQNVQANIPEAVTTDSRGFLTLADRPILAALVNAVKELGEKFDTLSESVKTKFVDADKVKTTELCIGDTCITEEEFKDVLRNRNTNSHSNTTSQTQTAEEDMSNEEPVVETVIEPVEESVGEPTPEPVVPADEVVAE